MSSDRAAQAITRRRLLAGLLGPALAAGCGFSPAYAPGGAATSLRGQVLPDPPGNASEFVFASRLEDRLGRAEEARFALAYDFDTRAEGLAITPDQETLRFNLIGTVRFSLRDRGTGQVVTSGVVENFTAYSAIGTTVATRASQNDAQRRLAVILADEVVTRLVATAPAWLT